MSQGQRARAWPLNRAPSRRFLIPSVRPEMAEISENVVVLLTLCRETQSLYFCSSSLQRKLDWATWYDPVSWLSWTLPQQSELSVEDPCQWRSWDSGMNTVSLQTYVVQCTEGTNTVVGAEIQPWLIHRFTINGDSCLIYCFQNVRGNEKVYKFHFDFVIFGQSWPELFRNQSVVYSQTKKHKSTLRCVCWLFVWCIVEFKICIYK